MAISETSSKKDAPPKRRKHGYRGYPNGRSTGGDIHWGSGFAGIGAMNGPIGSSGILTERTRHDAARHTGDDDDTLDQ